MFKNLKLSLAVAPLCFVLLAPEPAASYYVSVGGSDQNPGSEALPFRTIQRAADLMRPGDTCIVRGGRYRETVHISRSGKPGQPIRFEAFPGEKVILDGTEPLQTEWTLHEGSIYKTKSPVVAFEQLFNGERMLTEARWPNQGSDQILDRSGWAQADEGSGYGRIDCPELAKTGVDWTGALVVLNVAHQFWTWTRTVRSHQAGSSTITYDRDLGALDRFVDRPEFWSDDYFYLVGKIAALDAPGEWFWDSGTGSLYLYPEKDLLPEKHQLSYKKRDYAFLVRGSDYIEITGFEFFGTTFNFQAANHCTVEACRLRFPSYTRRVTEFDPSKSPSAATQMTGDHNTVRKTSLAYANNTGLLMLGSFNTVEDCIVHDVNWFGSLTYPGVKLFPSSDADGGQGNSARRNTLYNCGNAILCFNGKNSVIEYNHVFNGGLLCKDVALVYTQQPTTEGSQVRYNWVHGCRTAGHLGRGGSGGLGIRGDDQTRGLSVHHNVVWDCGRDGIIIKGDRNLACNNTVLGIGSGDQPGNFIHLPVQPEPVKPWRFQYPLLQVQNANSLLFNNAAQTLTSSQKGVPFPSGEQNLNNFTGKELQLSDPNRLDFRPRKGSPLIDAGRIVPGVTEDFQGSAPDIGAYEFGGEYWKAGATWQDQD